jgi:molecular chaperone GrpE
MSDDQDVKVVDRRWWVRAEAGEDEGETPLRKPTYVEDLERQLADKDAQLQSLIAKYREASGEFDNARARLRKEIGKEIERGKRTILVELLDVVDNLDRAIEAARQSSATTTLLQGVELVRDQFLGKLDGFGVKRMEALGAPFDPAYHEAASTVPAPTPEQHDRVAGIIRHGYLIGNDVLRPAVVAVSHSEPAS